MNIKNPFIKGTVAFQNFNNDVLANKHLTTPQLIDAEKALCAKKDNYLNYSDIQRTGFEYNALALNSIIVSRQNKVS